MEFKSDSWSFWETLDKSILVEDERPSSGKDVSMYPSEAAAFVKSANGNAYLIGGCRRKSWFRNKLQRQQKDKEHQTALFDEILFQDFTPKELWKFEISRRTEDLITDESKRASIWETNSHRFEWLIPYSSDLFDFEKYGSFLIRGEVDLVVRPSPEKLPIGIEIKSITGYYGQKQVFGTKSKYGHWINPPTPKEQNLLQTVLYAFKFSIIEKQYQYFKLVYFSREDGRRIEFNVDLIPEEVMGSTRHKVYLNGKPYIHNLYAEDIIDSYRYIHKHIVDDTLPPRDFDLQYPDEKIKALAASGELSKTDMEKFKKNKPVVKGDWECSYCNYKSMCYKGTTPIDYSAEQVEFDFSSIESAESEEDAED